MADLAASQGRPIQEADFGLGEEVAASYERLWNEVGAPEIIPDEQRYRITERVRRLNSLGFEVDEIELEPDPNHKHLRLKVRVADRSWHANRLRELTGLEVSENQARQLLSDFHYWEMLTGSRVPSDRAVRASKWRVEVYAPWLIKLANRFPGLDPVQAYCDLLTHRYYRSVALGRDVGTEAAFEDYQSVAPERMSM
jgi:hypothetical protein